MIPTIDDLAYIHAHRDRSEAAMTMVLNAEKPRNPGRGEDDRNPVSGVEFVGIEITDDREVFYNVRLTNAAAGILMEAMAQVRIDEKKFWGLRP